MANSAIEGYTTEREIFIGVNQRLCLQALITQVQGILASKGVNAMDLLNQGWQQDFKYFTCCEPSAYRQDITENLIHLKRSNHRAVITYGRLHLQPQDAPYTPFQAVDDSLNVSKKNKFQHTVSLSGYLLEKGVHRCTTKVTVNSQMVSNDDIQTHIECNQTPLMLVQIKPTDLHPKYLWLQNSQALVRHNDVWTKTVQPRSFINVSFWTKQFKPLSSSNDVGQNSSSHRSSSNVDWDKTESRLGVKSISLTEAEDAVAREVHATHADKVALKEFDLKSALFKHMNKNKNANRNPANYHLYHAIMEALIADEDAMDKEVAVKLGQQRERRPRICHFWSAQPPSKDDDQSQRNNNGSLMHLLPYNLQLLTSTVMSDQLTQEMYVVKLSDA
ncbi:hypothetical protein Tco_0339617 [Tanacetum coccineum]